MMRIASLYSKFKRPLCGAALLLVAGCAGTQDGGVDAQADAGSVPVAVETALTEIPETFTTVGKPTKTIETPLGPREVYNPAKDEVVRGAFERLYEDGTKVVARRNAGTKFNDESDESTVFYARDAYYKSIIAEGCNILLSADCSTIYYFKPLIKINGQPLGNYEECLNSKQGNCRWKNITIRMITPSSHCTYGGDAWHSHESTSWCPISRNVKSVGCHAAPEKKRSLNESIDWFFQDYCRQWEASK